MNLGDSIHVVGAQQECNHRKGGTLTGGYGFGYVSDMYPSPFRYVSDSLF